MKYPSLKARKIERILLENGFVVIRQSGSYRTYHNSNSGCKPVVPFHAGDVKPGTVRSIVKQSGLDESLFR